MKYGKARRQIIDKVVVDANVALRWVLKDEKEPQADALLYQWAISLTDILVPPLFLSEITNALYISVKRQRLNSDKAILALQTILQLGAKVVEPAELYLRSLEINFPRPYGRGFSLSQTSFALHLFYSLQQLLSLHQKMQGELHPSTLWSGI